jgi:hypothetical protein
MRATIATLAVSVLLALVAPSAASAATCTEPGVPLFGVARVDGQRVVAQIDRRTLRPRAAGRVALPRGVTGWNWAYSPDCQMVALAGRRGGRIQLVDLARARRAGTVSVGGWAAAGAIAWPVPDRLISIAGPYPRPRVVTVSVPDGQIVANPRIGGVPAATEPTTLGLAVVAAPRDRIGAATLVLARPDGGALRVPLDRIRAGYEAPRRNPLLGRQLTPALAVDEASGRAYVVAANEPLVAEVDLLSGAVGYHELQGGRGRAGSPTASKGLSYGAFRSARWIAPGTIAVSGEETRMRRNWRRAVRRGGLPATIDPYGLQLIDTAGWTVRTVDRSLRWFAHAGDMLVGADVLPVTQDRSRATGLVAYGVDGRRRFSRFAGDEHIGLWGASWPYAYVTDWRPRQVGVIDLRTGRTERLLPRFRLPVLFSDST